VDASGRLRGSCPCGCCGNPVEGAVCVWVLLSPLYATSPAAVRIWIVATFGTLLFLAGMGFWGIARFNYVFGQVCAQPLKFDPYHADGLGGLAFLGQFNIKGPQYFWLACGLSILAHGSDRSADPERTRRELTTAGLEKGGQREAATDPSLACSCHRRNGPWC